MSDLVCKNFVFCYFMCKSDSKGQELLEMPRQEAGKGNKRVT